MERYWIKLGHFWQNPVQVGYCPSTTVRSWGEGRSIRHTMHFHHITVHIFNLEKNVLKWPILCNVINGRHLNACLFTLNDVFPWKYITAVYTPNNLNIRTYCQKHEIVRRATPKTNQRGNMESGHKSRNLSNGGIFSAGDAVYWNKGNRWFMYSCV